MSSFSVLLFSIAAMALAGDGPRTVEVLIAKRDLQAYETLKEPQKLFTKLKYRAGDEPEDAITSLEGLNKYRVKWMVRKGFPLTRADITTRAPIEIPEGTQAIGVRVSKMGLPFGAARLYGGTRIDLVLIIRGERDTRRIELLKDALVLSSNWVEPEPDLVILALKQVDVLKINAAMDMGELRVIVPERMESMEARDTK
jgi:Flp pilus assembly protein CpaB